MMKMIKFKLTKILLITAVIALLVLTACEPGEVDDLLQYRTGISGLKIQFIDFPEHSVDINEEFSYSIELENHGGYDVDDGRLTISSDARLPLIDKDNKPLARDGYIKTITDLKGRSFNYPDGGYIDPFYFTHEPKDILGSESSLFSIIANVCYSYQTEALLVACIGTKRGRRGCNLENDGELDLGNGQGAPLAITNVKQSLIVTDNGQAFYPKFKFTVENKMDGSVYRDLNKIAQKACSSTPPGRKVLNKFDFSIQLSNKYKFDSKTDLKEGEGSVSGDFNCGTKIPRLEDDQVEITCKLKEPLSSNIAYQTELVIDLDYVYKASETKEIMVIKPD